MAPTRVIAATEPFSVRPVFAGCITLLRQLPIDDDHDVRGKTRSAEHLRLAPLSHRGPHRRALLIGRGDSRGDSPTAFNAAPGALCVIGKVASLAPPYGSDDRPHGALAAAAE